MHTTGSPKAEENNVVIQLLLHMKNLRFINDNMHCIITFVNRLIIKTDPFFVTSIIIMRYATFQPLLVDDAPTRTTTKTCYRISRPITRALSIQKGSKIVKNEHARYTLERFPTDNARVICTKKGIGKYGIMY